MGVGGGQRGRRERVTLVKEERGNRGSHQKAYSLSLNFMWNSKCNSILLEVNRAKSFDKSSNIPISIALKQMNYE